MADDENIVHYTVKELLADIKSSIDRLYGKLDGKADRADVETLHRRVDVTNGRVDRVDERVLELETDAEHRRRNEAEDTEEKRVRVPLKQNFWLIVLTIAVVVEGALGWVIH